MKPVAYVHSLREMAEVKKLGFEYVALHSMLFPGIEMGNAPNDEQVGMVTRALKENELKPVDLVTFNGWHSLGLSGMMEQLPSSPSDPQYQEVRKRGVKQFADRRSGEGARVRAGLHVDGRSEIIPL